MEIKLDFDKLGGLIPAIVQDEKTNEILMLAFMNEESWNKTLQTKKAHYYSRSRNKLWMKGEESGNIQEVKDILIDCDEDTILIKVNQIGNAACHTGHVSCFFRKLKGTEFEVEGVKLFNPEEKYGKT
ncbi:phosphoribosyl-AMP cyclohydrolase [Candidatus Pacearchaeota archaeon CG10_big_fil_rev_8_21_14_0_10_31_24]|nr:MAG: phosphoribosyl-AMP cyclohydrolase [Candidatus Pacearchaeota archaeon CG10_big_fil_rev_8_21_14_0_10_31_24]